MLDRMTSKHNSCGTNCSAAIAVKLYRHIRPIKFKDLKFKILLCLIGRHRLFADSGNRHDENRADNSDDRLRHHIHSIVNN